MNLNYYYHRSKMNYDDRPLVESLTKVMHKCIKLYMLIDTFMKIFTMIAKKEELEKIGRMKFGDKKYKDTKMAKRILVAIKLLLKECPIMPPSFKFKGECLLEKFKNEIKTSDY